MLQCFSKLQFYSQSEEMEAPESRNSLSPICIGNTLRAGSTMGVDGTVAVRLEVPLVPGPGLWVSKSGTAGLGRLSDVSMALRKRPPGAV